VVEPPVPGVILRAANGCVVSVAYTEQEARALAHARGYKDSDLTSEPAKMVRLSDAIGDTVKTKTKVKTKYEIHQDKAARKTPLP
jgi:hypothetical protein